MSTRWKKVANTRFANDAVLMGKNDDELTELRRRIVIESGHLGQEINKDYIRFSHYRGSML